MDKGAEAHVFALGETAGSPRGWSVGYEGRVSFFSLPHVL